MTADMVEEKQLDPGLPIMNIKGGTKSLFESSIFSMRVVIKIFVWLLYVVLSYVKMKCDGPFIPSFPLKKAKQETHISVDY